jgi:hypothetical protein
MRVNGQYHERNFNRISQEYVTQYSEKQPRTTAKNETKEKIRRGMHQILTKSQLKELEFFSYKGNLYLGRRCLDF